MSILINLYTLIKVFTFFGDFKHSISIIQYRTLHYQDNHGLKKKKPEISFGSNIF